jgi:hypothetical protein
MALVYYYAPKVQSNLSNIITSGLRTNAGAIRNQIPLHVSTARHAEPPAKAAQKPAILGPRPYQDRYASVRYGI